MIPATPPPPSEPGSGTARRWAGLLVLMLGYAALFVVYYPPPIVGIEDEVGFINQALVWSRGSLTAEGAGLPGLPDFFQVGDAHVSIRHPGRSLVLLPFLAVGGLRATPASGLLIHLATTLIAALTLARLGRSPTWAVLVLFHPTMAIYSRTALADEAAGAGLLGAGLALTYPGAAAAVAAGLAVGVAALMRYQAALALPSAALACLLPPGRARPRRDAAACLVAAAAAGGLIVVYNLYLYQNPFKPKAYHGGFFSADFLLGTGGAESNLLFYMVALSIVWPGLLVAPLLDRTRLRWLARGVAASFLLFLGAYYYHDKGQGALETWILGQRLMQVALPVWVVSYATVIDDYLVTSLRRRIGDRAWRGIATAACLTLLVLIGVMFRRHERRLEAFDSARNAIIAAVPDGSLLLTYGPVAKLVSVPLDTPRYRLRTYVSQHGVTNLTSEIAAERADWYLAGLPKVPGEPMPEPARELIDRHGMQRVETADPSLVLYVAPASADGARP